MNLQQKILQRGSRILLTGIAGTTGMTLFSYLVSRKQNKQFREPQLLQALLHRNEQKANATNKTVPVTGFVLHYGMGAVFSSCYHLFWKKHIHTNPLINGVGFGLSCAIAGLSVWKAAYKIHPNPPANDFSSYMKHLVVAHTVFGLGLTLTDSQLKMPQR